MIISKGSNKVPRSLPIRTSQKCKGGTAQAPTFLMSSNACFHSWHEHGVPIESL